MTKFTYRPKIDGFRVFAIIPVILFHAVLVSFEGRYVGVDVFFVLKGARYFGKAIYDFNWLKPLDQLFE